MHTRIVTLDWLRGLMALSIMFYHLTYWFITPLTSNNPLGRLGIYGVSIFFILSGLSMAIVYNSYLKSVRDAINFYLRRVFRIWPLLWVATILTLLPQLLTTGMYDWKIIFLNLTTLFGFYRPTNNIATGAWSIGNEMVYYAMTPFIFYIYNINKKYGNILCLVSIIITLVFAFYIIDGNQSVQNQWHLYANPFNNLFFYILGIAIYYNFNHTNIKLKTCAVILASAIVLLFVLPSNDDAIDIITGWNRVVFSLMSFIIVFCFYKLNIDVNSNLGQFFEKIGIITYGVYILHPVVYKYSELVATELNFQNNLAMFIGIPIVTIVVSIFLYQNLELKIVNLGKKITSKKRSPISNPA